jgi:hypothetical protein
MELAMQDLTDELKRLGGRGATPKRLALMPVLRELANAEDASYTAQGYIVLAYLKDSIDRVERPITFRGREVQPATLRRAYKLLLGIEGVGLKQEARRARVIQCLGIYCTVETWRRPNGPEREFLAILAGQMVERHSDQPVA